MKRNFNINITFSHYFKFLLILLIPYANLILDFIFANLTYLEIGTLSFYLPFFYLFLGTSFFVEFNLYKNKNLKNNISKIIFIFMMLVISILICLLIKYFYPINNSILNIYNDNYIYMIFNLSLMLLFFSLIDIEKINFKQIILFYLILFANKYFLVDNFNSIFITNSIIYFIFLLINLICQKNIQNFIHTLDFSGKTNFLVFFLKKIDLKPYFDFFSIFLAYGNLAFKAFQYLFIIFLINKYGILNNISSFFLINIIFDLFFIPIITIIFNKLFYNFKTLTKKDFIKVSTYCIILQIIFSIFIYLFIYNIINLFNFENGIISYSIYIFKILAISFAIHPLLYIFPIYCYYLKNKSLLISYYLINYIFIFGIIILFLKNYNLNGIFFSIPISIIISNIIFIFILKFKNYFNKVDLIHTKKDK